MRCTPLKLVIILEKVIIKEILHARASKYNDRIKCSEQSSGKVGFELSFFLCDAWLLFFRHAKIHRTKILHSFAK